MVIFDTYVSLPEGMMFLDKIRRFCWTNLFSLGFDVFPLPQPETLSAIPQGFRTSPKECGYGSGADHWGVSPNIQR